MARIIGIARRIRLAERLGKPLTSRKEAEREVVAIFPPRPIIAPPAAPRPMLYGLLTEADVAELRPRKLAYFT
jgi:hypothetical protein